MMTWVQSVLGASHFFPETLPGDQTWFAALAGDDASAMHALVKPLYVAPSTLFVIVGLVWFLVCGLVGGASSEAQVAASILAHGAMLVSLALFPLFSVRSLAAIKTSERIAVAGAALVFAAASSFLSAFSPLGVHNVGLLTLVVGAVAVTRYLDAARRSEEVRGARLLAVAAQAAACFANQANLFILPVATLMVMAGLPRGRRWREAARFSALTGLTLSPAVLLLVITVVFPADGGATQSFGGIAKWVFTAGDAGIWDYLSSNFLSWFVRAGTAFSNIGVAAGIAGLLLYGWRYGQWLPLGIVAAHLLAWTTIGGFGANFGQHSRTIAYVLPFLALGLGAWVGGVVGFFGVRWRMAAAVTGVAAGVLHLIHDAPRLADPRRVEAWSTYYTYQGEWRAVSAGIATLVQPDARLVAWDQRTAYIISSLQEPGGNFPRLLPLLQTLDDRQRQGSLESYLARKHLASVRYPAGVYLLLPSAIDPADATHIASRTLCRFLLTGCSRVSITQIAGWPVHEVEGQRLVLYSVQPIQQ